MTTQRPAPILVSPHFQLKEWLVTSTGLPNEPTAAHLAAMTATSTAVLEVLRDRWGPIEITSGYRSKAVNDELRRRGYHASSTSQHLRGQAADIRPYDVPLDEAWHELVRMVVEEGLPVDQAIFYVRAPGRGWLHVSHTTVTVPRGELLVDTPHAPRPVAWSKYSGPLVLP